MTDGSQVQKAFAARPVQRTEDEPESRLVEQAKSDPQAFGLLYERYVERIYNYVFYRTGNQQEAEDLQPVLPGRLAGMEHVALLAATLL